MSDLQKIQNYISHFFGKLSNEDIIMLLVPRHVFEENKKKYEKNAIMPILNNRRMCNDKCQRRLVQCFNDVKKAYSESVARASSQFPKDSIVTVAQHIALQYKNTRELSNIKKDLVALEHYIREVGPKGPLPSLKAYMHTQLKDISKRIETGNFKINNYIIKTASGGSKRSYINGVPEHMIRYVEDMRKEAKPVAKKIYKASECIRSIV